MGGFRVWIDDRCALGIEEIKNEIVSGCGGIVSSVIVEPLCRKDVKFLELIKELLYCSSCEYSKKNFGSFSANCVMVEDDNPSEISSRKFYTCTNDKKHTCQMDWDRIDHPLIFQPCKKSTDELTPLVVASSIREKGLPFV